MIAAAIAFTAMIGVLLSDSIPTAIVLLHTAALAVLGFRRADHPRDSEDRRGARDKYRLRDRCHDSVSIFSDERPADVSLDGWLAVEMLG
jgi:hypothetical protein